jgi:4-hydroxy-3-methylbut-2-enyl diphosphate reductase
MNVIRATELGMCFGVRDALQIADSISDPTQVTIHGELVHNPIVNQRLKTAGFRQSAENERQGATETPRVLITAHGISNVERARLAQFELIDTTCPLVRRAHDAAMELQAEGRHVLLIGKIGHVEVTGIVEDLESYDIVAEEKDVRCYAKPKVGIISQTTIPANVVTAICNQIRQLNSTSDIRFIDTVCRPTKQRQSALQELLPRVDAVVVVGGSNSNNSKRLVQLCHDQQKPAWRVERADELDPDWFRDVETVGLTAGTSTLDETIHAVQAALEQIHSASEKRAVT